MDFKKSLWVLKRYVVGGWQSMVVTWWLLLMPNSRGPSMVKKIIWYQAFHILSYRYWLWLKWQTGVRKVFLSIGKSFNTGCFGVKSECSILIPPSTCCSVKKEKKGLQGRPVESPVQHRHLTFPASPETTQCMEVLPLGSAYCQALILPFSPVVITNCSCATLWSFKLAN